MGVLPCAASLCIDIKPFSMIAGQDIKGSQTLGSSIFSNYLQLLLKFIMNW